MDFHISVDPGAEYGRGIYQDGLLLETPLPLIWGAVNAVTVRLATGEGAAGDVPVTDFTRTVVRVVWPEEVLAVTGEGVAVRRDEAGFVTVSISDVALDTPNIVNRICDHRVEDRNCEPDYEEQHTYCRATLEILGYADFGDETIRRRIGIPVKIFNQSKSPLGAPPEPRSEYLTAGETAAAIRQALEDVAAEPAAMVVPVADRVYYHANYGTVCYLDDENDLAFVGYQAAGWSRIKLWLVTADGSVTGNIVLKVGSARFVAAVGASVAAVELEFSVPATGLVAIERDTIDASDTLKDGSGNIVTALAVDWRVC